MIRSLYARLSFKTQLQFKTIKINPKEFYSEVISALSSLNSAASRIQQRGGFHH